MAEEQNRSWVDRYMLRLPDGMRDRIKTAAEANNRSMNAEIVATLEEKYPAPTKPVRLDMLEFFLEGYEAKLRRAMSENNNAEADRLRLVIETLQRDIADFQEAVQPGPDSWLNQADGYGDGAYGDSDGNGDGMGGRS